MFARGPRSASYVFLHSFPPRILSRFFFRHRVVLHSLLFSRSLSLSLALSAISVLVCGLVRGSGGTKELVNGFIWIRSSPYLSYPPLCSIRVSVARFISPPL